MQIGNRLSFSQTNIEYWNICFLKEFRPVLFHQQWAFMFLKRFVSYHFYYSTRCNTFCCESHKVGIASTLLNTLFGVCTINLIFIDRTECKKYLTIFYLSFDHSSLIINRNEIKCSVEFGWYLLHSCRLFRFNDRIKLAIFYATTAFK